MDVREKLVELIHKNIGCDQKEQTRIANNFIACGVTIPVYCSHCENYTHDYADDRYWCKMTGEYVQRNDFCSKGKMGEK